MDKKLEDEVFILTEVESSTTNKDIKEICNQTGCTLDESYDILTAGKKSGNPKYYYKVYISKCTYDQKVAELKKCKGILEILADDAAISKALEISLEGKKYSLRKVFAFKAY